MGDYESSPPDEAELGLFLGKRRSFRALMGLDVRCRGREPHSYAGRTVDVSRGGMLLEITDSRFGRFDGTGPLVTIASGVMLRFPDGIEVEFGDGAIRVHADVVRLISAPDAPCGVRIGCRFDPPLSELECGLVGIDVAFDETSD